MDPSVLFRRPLIVGASVSGDAGTASPGKRLGWRYGEPANVRTIAQGGTPGREVIERVDVAALGDRSVVVAIDFLFWDSTHPAPRESAEALDELVRMTRELEIPLILGDIPELIPGRQRARAALNRAIRDAEASNPHVSVLGLEELYLQALRNGIESRGRRYSLRELVPDGLHLSEAASEFLADRIVAMLQRK